MSKKTERITGEQNQGYFIKENPTMLEAFKGHEFFKPTVQHSYADYWVALNSLSSVVDNS